MTKLQGFSRALQWLFGGIFASAAWVSGGVATADTAEWKNWEINFDVWRGLNNATDRWMVKAIIGIAF